MRRLAVLAVVVIVILVPIAFRIATRGQEAPAPGIEEVQAREGIPVDVATVREGMLTAVRRLSGEVKGWRQTDLTAPDDRKVERVDVREGDRVRRGDPVLRFDTRTSPDAVARLDQAREAYADAERQVRRLEPLLEQGAVAESDFDAANTRLKTAEADLRDARLKVEVVSPINGVVTLLTVNAGDAVAAGTVVAQVASLDTVRIEAEVSTDVARELDPGARVFLAEDRDEDGEPVNLKGAEVPPSTTREGILRRVSLGADPVTRLHLVEAVAANPGARLRPGEYVTLNVLVREVGPTRIAPRAALLTDRSPKPGDAVPVYVLEDDIAQLRTVQVGTVSEDDVEIREGLEAGDRVVTFGANRLQDGVKVKIHSVDGVRAEPPS